MRIAHFSPLPPQPTGIADYCAALLPHLAEHMAVDVFAPLPAGEMEATAVSTFLQNAHMRLQYDLCLYHMGNHPAYHRQIFACLQRFPGIVVLHEFDLRAFFQQQTAAVYKREMGFAHGLAGINRVFSGKTDAPMPLAQRIAQVSLGIIVHTSFAQRMLQGVTRTPVAAIPLAVALPQVRETAILPPFLTSLPRDTILLGSFGYLAASKRVEIVLQALAQLQESAPPFRYLLVGQPTPDFDVNSLIAAYGLADVVIHTGYLPPDDFAQLLQLVDIGVNLRTGPTGGEMSATLVQLLAHGRPALVSNVGSFADLPAECVVKIDQDAAEVEQVRSRLYDLMTNAALREAYGRSAQAYVNQNHSFPHTAARYKRFMQACLQQISRPDDE